MLQCFCSEKAVLVKKWRQRPFIVAVRVRMALLSQLIVMLFLKTFWRVSCSAMRRAPLPGLTSSAKGYWKQPVAAPCFWMRSGNFHLPFRKLLRFLQEQRLQRVGGRQELQVDTRLVAATNANLKELIDNGKFREDLYFRLAVVTIRLMPLRERGEDIVFLAREFLQRYGSQNGRTRMVFAPDALRAMSCYSWPGNVRELQNRVKRGVIMASGSRVTAKDRELERHREVVSSAATTLRQAREHVEREMVEQALKK